MAFWESVMPKRIEIVVAVLIVALPNAAHAWTRSYVVRHIEPAFYYGGPESGSVGTPGTDCPNGINPSVDWQKLLTTQYRSAMETAAILDPEYRARGGDMYSPFPFRGPTKESIYENPTALPDPGLIEVAVDGNVAYGFDLDDNPKTGFKGVDGTLGVDNAFYKSSGCVNSYRGPQKSAYYFNLANERIRAGERTIIIVLSGAGGDPMNDDSVVVGVYASKDRIVKDANGAVSSDVTFRVNPAHQSVFKAKIVEGVLESTERPSIHLHYAIRGIDEDKLTDLYQSKVKLTTMSDGSMQGFVGGYLDWYRAYAAIAHNGAAPENLGRYTMPGWYYSLRRNADGLPDSKGGNNRGISAAYSLELQPAFVITPSADKVVSVAEIFPR